MRPFNAQIDVDRIVRPHDEQRLMHSYLSLGFLILTYLGLIVAEIYYMSEASKIRSIERQAIKVKDISKVWPENEEKLVYI